MKKKQPEDYPVLSFRIDKESKDRMLKDVDVIINDINKDKGSTEYLVRKNAIYKEALRLGLSKLKKKHV